MGNVWEITNIYYDFHKIRTWQFSCITVWWKATQGHFSALMSRKHNTHHCMITISANIQHSSWNVQYVGSRDKDTEVRCACSGQFGWLWWWRLKGSCKKLLLWSWQRYLEVCKSKARTILTLGTGDSYAGGPCGVVFKFNERYFVQDYKTTAMFPL